MKLNTLLFLAAALTVGLADEPAGGSARLRSERKERRDALGHVIASVEMFYRGNRGTKDERILEVEKYKRKNEDGWMVRRSFWVSGSVAMAEIADGNGSLPVIEIFKDDKLAEMFRRNPDGSVEPVSSEELAKVRKEYQEMMTALGDVFGRVRGELETNSVNQVTRELRTELEQQQEKAGEEGASVKGQPAEQPKQPDRKEPSADRKK